MDSEQEKSPPQWAYKYIPLSGNIKKYNFYKGIIGKIKKNRINRKFNTSISYQKISTDTTKFKYYLEDETRKLQTKKRYLDPYLDMYNLEILSYLITNQPNGETLLQGLEEVIKRTQACPCRRTSILIELGPAR